MDKCGGGILQQRFRDADEAASREGEGLKWLGGYKYISDTLRNPAMRLQYNASDVRDGGFSMEEAREKIGKLVREMLDGCSWRFPSTSRE